MKNGKATLAEINTTATLGQVQKVLSLLDGIPSVYLQKVIESGILTDIIRMRQVGERGNPRIIEEKARALRKAFIDLFCGN